MVWGTIDVVNENNPQESLPESSESEDIPVQGGGCCGGSSGGCGCGGGSPR